MDKETRDVLKRVLLFIGLTLAMFLALYVTQKEKPLKSCTCCECGKQ